MPNPLYTLDFDGVICDSAVETSITGWKAASQIWLEMGYISITTQDIDAFRYVRPYLETGYEAILIMHLLYKQIPVKNLCEHYDSHMKELLSSEKLDVTELKSLFGETRDCWIKEDEADWLKHNPLFNGIVEKLQALHPDDFYIITTKQERFVDRIMEGNRIAFHSQHVFGMDRQMSKQDVLLQLQKSYPSRQIIFVEDRLPTLYNILKNPTLKTVELQFADWGYNTQTDKEKAKKKHIRLINLDEFLVVT